jgi:hypothetical protein
MARCVTQAVCGAALHANGIVPHMARSWPRPLSASRKGEKGAAGRPWGGEGLLW